METISLKLSPALAKDLDKHLKKFNYSTKTEFIRSAIQNKLEQEKKKQQAWDRLLSARGKWKGLVKDYTDEEFNEWRMKSGESIMRELAKEHGIDYDQMTSGIKQSVKAKVRK